MQRIARPVVGTKADRRQGSARPGETAVERVASPVVSALVDRRHGSARTGYRRHSAHPARAGKAAMERVARPVVSGYGSDVTAGPAWPQMPTPMTAAAMTARRATSKMPRRGAGRVRGMVAVICVATIVLLVWPLAAASAVRWHGQRSGMAVDAESTPALSRLYAIEVDRPCDSGRAREGLMCAHDLLPRADRPSRACVALHDARMAPAGGAIRDMVRQPWRPFPAGASSDLRSMAACRRSRSC